MPKYYYKPISSVVTETYLSNTGVDISSLDGYDLNVELVVTASDESGSDKIRMTITDKLMWELDRVEDEG